MEAAPTVGYWSRTFIGWVAYDETILLIHHGVATGWEPIADQAAAKPRHRPRRNAETGRGSAPTAMSTKTVLERHWHNH